MLGDFRARTVPSPVWGRLTFTFAAVVALFAAYATLPLDRPSGVLVGAVLVVATVPLLMHHLRGVRRSSQPFVDAVAAVTLVFALLVVGSAATYYALATADPTAFQGLETKIDAMYFTVIVMATIGFGDIVPLSQAARLITTLHLAFAIVMAGGSVRLLTRAARDRRAHREV